MNITVAAVGTRLEPWIYEVFDSYRARLPRHLGLQLEEVPLARRTAGSDS
ncbi:MAG: 23S rRNA (pseudouridine(1915)-N(3))-methyltransferase RlmH, partial [Gammaproteobacteria bacterium]|nr:23S rRNA (pseudouridine(1915)-N(3))-methyltransferase RlmH [Gammaproteobacteria bacterium]